MQISPEPIATGAVIVLALALVEMGKMVVGKVEKKGNGFSDADREKIINLIAHQNADREILLTHLGQMTRALEVSNGKLDKLITIMGKSR